MMFSQSGSVLVYLGCMLGLLLAGGCLALHLPGLLLVPRWPRFLVGTCTALFAIPPLMVTTAIIMPGAPRAVFLGVPPVLALCVIIIYGHRTWLRLRRHPGRGHGCGQATHPSCAVGLLFAVAAVLAAGVLIKNTFAPFMFGDILEYVGNGLLFATQRSCAALRDMGFNGAADGSLRGYMHSYAWPLYLSYALMFNGGQPLGYPWDHAVRVAVQLTIGVMGLAVMALVRVRWPSRVGMLALMVVLAVPCFSYITVNCSRDAFRLIPLLLLTTALGGLSPHRMSRRLPLLAFVPLMLFSTMSLGGHTLGGIIAAFIFLAWALWIMKGGQIPWENLIKVALALAIGLALSSAQYVEALGQTGMVDGNTIGVVTKPPVIAAAPAVTKPLASALAVFSGAARNVVRAIMHDGHLIGLAGTITALGLIMWYWPRRPAWRRDVLPFLSLIILCFFIPFTGVFNIFGVKLSDLMFSNPRYLLHCYPIIAVVIAAFLGSESVRANSVAPGATPRHRQAGWLPRVKTLMTMLIGLVAVATVGKEWVPRSLFNYQKLLEEKFMPIVQVARGLGHDERLLLEDDRYNYYLSNRAMVMASQPARWIVRAETDMEAEWRLNESRIILLALQEESLAEGGWADKAMLRVAQRKCRAPMRIPSLYGDMKIFIVGDFAAYYNRVFDRFDAEPLSEAGVDRTMYIDCYVNEVAGRGRPAIIKAIAGQRERASEQVPWRYVILGRLFEQTGQPEAAAREYLLARKFWPATERYPSYYDEMNLARARAAAAAGQISEAISAFREVARQTTNPLLRGAALAAEERLHHENEAAAVGSTPWAVTSCRIPAAWMVPDEWFWKSFVPQTTYYKLPPIRGGFVMDISESGDGEVLRVMPGVGACLGSDYIQVGLWLPERRSWVRQDAANKSQCLPLFQAGATLHFSAAVRLSSANEDARLVIRGLSSSAEASKSVGLRGTDWVTSGVSRVVASDFKESRWCSRYLASLPFDRLPGRWRSLAGLASFFPDEQKYAPVIEWVPKATNAWMEVRDARLLVVAP